MLLPEQLYQLTPRDVGQEWARFFRRTANAQGLVVSPTGDIVLPADEAVLLTVIYMENLTGAGNTYLRSEVAVRPFGELAANAIRIVQHHAEVGLAAGVRTSLNWSGQLWLPPSSIISFTGNYSAAANVNSQTCNLFGFSVPLGTLIK